VRQQRCAHVYVCCVCCVCAYVCVRVCVVCARVCCVCACVLCVFVCALVRVRVCARVWDVGEVHAYGGWGMY